MELLYVRLACLTLLNHTPLAGKESLALGDIHSPFYLDDHNECILPWELRVLAVRLQALEAGDSRRGVQGYYDLAAYARRRIRMSGDAEVKGLWKDRLRDLGVRVGNALVEMGDLEAGRRHFETLAEATNVTEENTTLSSWIAMLCLRMGNLERARTWTCGDRSAGGASAINSSQLAKHDVLSPLLNMAEGDYGIAATEWRSLLQSPHNVLAKQNLAVCLLYTGQLSEVYLYFLLHPTLFLSAVSSISICILYILTHTHQTSQLLEELVNDNHAFYALTFNLATVYELSTDKSRDRKMQLAERVAEGLRKNAADAEGRRIERSNVDFKL